MNTNRKQVTNNTSQAVKINTTLNELQKCFDEKISWDNIENKATIIAQIALKHIHAKTANELIQSLQNDIKDMQRIAKTHDENFGNGCELVSEAKCFLADFLDKKITDLSGYFGKKKDSEGKLQKVELDIFGACLQRLNSQIHSEKKYYTTTLYLELCASNEDNESESKRIIVAIPFAYDIDDATTYEEIEQTINEMKLAKVEAYILHIRMQGVAMIETLEQASKIFGLSQNTARNRLNSLQSQIINHYQNKVDKMQKLLDDDNIKGDYNLFLDKLESLQNLLVKAKKWQVTQALKIEQGQKRQAEILKSDIDKSKLEPKILETYELYLKHKTVKKVAEVLSLSRQAIHKRLDKIIK